MRKRGDKAMWRKFKLIVAVMFVGCSLAIPPVFAQNLVPAIHYWLIEIDGGVLANPLTPEVSILRAQCRERAGGIELDVNGGAHTPANAVVTITDTNAGTNFGSITAVQDLANPTFGTYFFQLSGNAAFTVCPTSVSATIPGAAPAVMDIPSGAVPPPVVLEGPISAIVDNGNGTGSITVMGITVAVPTTAIIHTPTANLTITQLADPTPLPGRSQPGFIGGTAIILGQTDGVTTTAVDLSTDLAENVVVAVITAANCTNADCTAPGNFLRVLGTPVTRQTDPRMPGKPPLNAFGFPLDLSQGGLVGSLVSVEGYFGQIGTVPATPPPPPAAAVLALVTKYYNDILGRAPEPGGAEFWAAEITRLVSLGIDVKEGFQALARTFFNTAEYNLPPGKTADQFVTDLYEAFLNRAPDPGGLAFWVDQLTQGVTRGMLITEFSNSAEAVAFLVSQLGAAVTRPENNLVNDFYRGVLGRLPDSAGFNGWLAQMRTAQCAGAQAVLNLSNQIALGFVQSAEYAARARDNAGFVEDLYNGILRRGAGIGETNGWIAQLTAGTTRDQLVLAFTASPEFQLRVQQVIAAGCAP